MTLFIPFVRRQFIDGGCWVVEMVDILFIDPPESKSVDIFAGIPSKEILGLFYFFFLKVLRVPYPIFLAWCLVHILRFPKSPGRLAFMETLPSLYCLDPFTGLRHCHLQPPTEVHLPGYLLVLFLYSVQELDGFLPRSWGLLLEI